MKLKASALFYAIVISMLVALLSGSFILTAYFSQTEIDSYLAEERAQTNAMSGINYLLSPQDEIASGESLMIDLYNEGKDSVLLQRKAWGAYEILLSTSASQKRTTQVAALAGSLLKESEHYALWLSDQDRPLKLAGNTMIKGNAYLPEAGVERAYIEGQSYSGERLIYGNAYKSGRALFQFDKPHAKELQALITADHTKLDSIIAIPEEDSIHRSFFGSSLALYQKGTIILSGKNISGQIIIISGKEIIVRKDALLDNVVLAAPIIRIDDEFSGTLQAFAGDSLIVGERCGLHYPSSLGIVRSERSADHMLLSIGKETKIKGAIFSWQETFDIRKTMLIDITEKCEITGSVYSAGILDLKGKVKGSITALKLLLRTPSSVYENHLLNAVIDITALPPAFGGMTTQKSNKTIIKWLD